ncbi:MAG: hypothetical protein RJB39_349 [Candidatus Parcubacteria bacterium]|jgi:L-ascorbate metabolism protein UlaG (beta-lactamase superfamily)
MILNFFGNQFFKFQVGDSVLATDPFSKESSFKAGKFGADVVLQSTIHEDMSGGEEYTYGNKVPHVIKGPGEYEVSGIFIKGYPAYTNYGEINHACGTTYYTFEFDGIRIAFLGALGKDEEKGEKKFISIEGEVDILMLPIAGDGRLSVKQAAEYVTNIEPKIVIPMGFSDIKDPHLQAFIKEMGETSAEPQEKLTIKKKEVEGCDQKLYILKP